MTVVFFAQMFYRKRQTEPQTLEHIWNLFSLLLFISRKINCCFQIRLTVCYEKSTSIMYFLLSRLISFNLLETQQL